MDDLISRQAAIDAINRNVYRHTYLEQIVDIIKNMPSAQPDANGRNVGKWIRHSIGHQNTPWGFDCSACGKWFVIGEDTANHYNYCPNCGADMKGEEDG